MKLLIATSKFGYTISGTKKLLGMLNNIKELRPSNIAYIGMVGWYHRFS